VSTTSLVHPLSTGSASKFQQCFDGEFYFHLVGFRVMCHVNSSLVDVENVEVGGGH
jgi:hypothetical protein